MLSSNLSRLSKEQSLIVWNLSRFGCIKTVEVDIEILTVNGLFFN